MRKLSKREGMLLKLLIGKEGEVVSREDILQMVWGYDVLLHAHHRQFHLGVPQDVRARPQIPKALSFSPWCGVQIHPLTRLDRLLR